ncbi:MAG: hypothetical protein WD178_02125 [Actinomycetota bacterium]
MRRVVVWLSALAMAGLSTACIRGPLERTAANLGDVRSGHMELRLVASTPQGQQVGFALTGPFSMPQGEQLPVADLTYTRFAGTSQDTYRFLSTGDAAFLGVGERFYRLPDEDVQSMMGSDDAGRRGPFSGLDLDDWVPDSEVVASSEDSDVETVTGPLDVVAAVNDILGIAREYGGLDSPDIEGDEAEQLRSAVDKAELTLVTGKDDRILRSLLVTMDLGSEPPEAFRRALEGFTGVNFTLELKLTEPNSEVSVQAPANPLPYESLGR